MAAPADVTPVFVDTLKGMEECLRLRGVQADNSAAANPFRQAVQWARTELYRRLGITRVATILTTAPVSNPSTAETLDRERAGQLEVHLVRWKLMQDLPVMFMHTGTTVTEVWNEEALTREVDADELAPILDRLRQLIEDDFLLLDGDPSTEPGSRSELFGAQVECPEPGGSVLPHPYNVWLRPATSKANRVSPFRWEVD